MSEVLSAAAIARHQCDDSVRRRRGLRACRNHAKTCMLPICMRGAPVHARDRCRESASSSLSWSFPSEPWRAARTKNIPSAHAVCARLEIFNHTLTTRNRKRSGFNSNINIERCQHAVLGHMSSFKRAARLDLAHAEERSPTRVCLERVSQRARRPCITPRPELLMA